MSYFQIYPQFSASQRDVFHHKSKSKGADKVLMEITNSLPPTAKFWFWLLEWQMTPQKLIQDYFWPSLPHTLALYLWPLNVLWSEKDNLSAISWVIIRNREWVLYCLILKIQNCTWCFLAMMLLYFSECQPQASLASRAHSGGSLAWASWGVSNLILV